MENNENKNIETEIDGANVETAGAGAADETSNEENKDTVTMTQKEFDLKIQGAEDRMRTHYSNQIKELKDKIAELLPVEKSEQEIDYEKRLAALEARERAIQKNDALSEKGIDVSLSQYLKDDVDVDGLATVLNTLYANKLKENSFIPSGHKSGETMTKEEFKKLDMTAREKIYNENPELYKTLAR